MARQKLCAPAFRCPRLGDPASIVSGVGTWDCGTSLRRPASTLLPGQAVHGLIHTGSFTRWHLERSKFVQTLCSLRLWWSRLALVCVHVKSQRMLGMNHAVGVTARVWCGAGIYAAQAAGLPPRWRRAEAPHPYIFGLLARSKCAGPAFARGTRCAACACGGGAFVRGPGALTRCGCESHQSPVTRVHMFHASAVQVL